MRHYYREESERESWSRRDDVSETAWTAIASAVRTGIGLAVEVAMAVGVVGAAFTAVMWMPPDSSSVVPWGEGGSGDGITVAIETTHLWLPESLASLADAEPRRALLKDDDALLRSLRAEGGASIRFAVTKRSYRADGLWVDATLLRRPCESPDHLQELKAALADGAGGPDRRVAAHFVPESMLQLDASAMIEEMRRIAGDDDLHRSPTLSSASGRLAPP